MQETITHPRTTEYNCIRQQLANPVYDVRALESIRKYYEQKNRTEVIGIIDQEILKRQK